MEVHSDRDPHREERLRLLKILRFESLTPFLRREIHHTITLYDQAPDPGVDIDILYDRINECWTRMHLNLAFKACMIQDIVMFHRFLTAVLLTDYTKELCVISSWVLNQADIVKRYRTGARCDADKTTYQDHIHFPLEQMMLNQDHVENKLLALSDYQERGSHIQHLIDRKDWSNLTATIRNDRELAMSLFKEEPFYRDLFNESTHHRVLRGIDDIQSKYLAKLDPITSTDVREELARQETSYNAEGSSSGFGWGILAAVRNPSRRV